MGTIIHPVTGAPTTRVLPLGWVSDRLSFRARPGTCFVMLTHRIDDFVAARYAQMVQALGRENDVYLMMTRPLPDGDLPVRRDAIIVLDEAEIFSAALKGNKHENRIVPGNTDLVMMAFARRFPLYQFYWMVESDVFFPAGPGALQALDRASRSDLIMLKVAERAAGCGWVWWKTFEPGALVDPPATAAPHPCRHVTGLFCISRYSNALLGLLEWSYRRGWSGHHEVTVPSIAASNGLPIDDLSSLAVRTLGHPLYEPGGFNVTESRPHFVSDAFAYHPVKTAEVAAALLQQIAQIGAGARGAAPRPADFVPEAPGHASPILASPILTCPILAEAVSDAPALATPALAPPALATPVLATPVLETPVLTAPALA